MSARGLAPATVRQAHRVLALVLTLAVRDGRIPRNPASGVPLPRARRADPRFLTRTEVERLADVAGGDGDGVRLLADTGPPVRRDGRPTGPPGRFPPRAGPRRRERYGGRRHRRVRSAKDAPAAHRADPEHPR